MHWGLLADLNSRHLSVMSESGNGLDLAAAFVANKNYDMDHRYSVCFNNSRRELIY